MIESYILPRNIGANIFLNKHKIFEPFFDINFFSSTNFFVSDKILIHNSWKHSFKEFGSENLTTYKVIEFLKEKNIVTEIDSFGRFNTDDYQDIIQETLFNFLIGALKHSKKRVPYKFIEKKIQNPIELIRAIYNEEEKLPVSLKLFGSKDMEILLNSVFSFIFSGNVVARIHDPKNHIGLFYNLNSIKQLSTDNEYNVTEHIVQICSENVPIIPLFLDKNSNRTYPETATFSNGYRWTYNNQGSLLLSKNLVSSKFNHIPIPDEKLTLTRLEKLVDFHQSRTCRDLRKLYNETRENFTGESSLDLIGKNREEFYKVWSIARAELSDRFKFSNKMDTFTEILSIPSTVLSLFSPYIGAIPLISWGISKASRFSSKEKFIKKYPWFFLAEQFGDLALNINKNKLN